MLEFDTIILKNIQIDQILCFCHGSFVDVFTHFPRNKRATHVMIFFGIFQHSRTIFVYEFITTMNGGS